MKKLLFVFVGLFVTVGILQAQSVLDNTTQGKTESSALKLEKDEILIFKTSASKLHDIEGILKFQVSSFTPILAVKVNNQAQRVIEGSTWGKYEVGYHLKRGVNRFFVLVQTQKGFLRKEFLLTYEPKKQQDSEIQPPSAFSMIAIVGFVESSNVTQLPNTDTPKAAGKTDLILVPSWKKEVLNNSVLSLDSILKIDRYQKREFEYKESTLRLLSVEWMEKEFFGGNWAIGLGGSVVSTKKYKNTSSRVPTQESGFQKEAQANFGFLRFETRFSNSAKIGFKVNQEAQTKPETPDEEGSIQTLSFQAKMNLWGIQNKLFARNSNSSFASEIKSSTRSNIKLSFDLVLQPVIYSLAFQNSDQQYKAVDPSSKLQVQVKKNAINLGFKYLFGTWGILNVSGSVAQYTSNDINRSFQEQRTTAQFFYIF